MSTASTLAASVRLPAPARGVAAEVHAEVVSATLEAGQEKQSQQRAQAQLILARARQRAVEARLPYAGAVTPQEAWELAAAGAAILVDVRTAEERKFVGQVPGSRHAPWATGLSLQRNPRFVRDLEAQVRREDVVLLLCRSGARSAAAAQAATEARFRNVFTVLEGFEGELDARQQRNTASGWRHLGLPWTQD